MARPAANAPRGTIWMCLALALVLVVRGARDLPRVVRADRCLPKVANRLRPAPAKDQWALVGPVPALVLVPVVPALILAPVVLVEGLAPVPADLGLTLDVLRLVDPSAGRLAVRRDLAPIGRNSNGTIPKCTPC